MNVPFASRVKGALLPMVGAERFDRLRLGFKLGYIPNIAQPRSYNEKLLHRKFYRPAPNSEFYADKWRVRDYVRAKVGMSVLNEVYATAGRPEEIDFDALPAQFAIKMNNASKRNILVTDKGALDIAKTRAHLNDWLRHPFGRLTSELFYLDIEPVIVIERYVPHDVFYSVHVFHGRAHYIETHADPFGPRHWSNWYDIEWTIQPFVQGTQGGAVLPRPRFLEEMIAVTERLGEEFDYVRIDLYPQGGTPLFCEMTLVPAAGYSPFKPTKSDFNLGLLW